MRILIVEDDIKTSAFLKKGLTEQGYVIDVTLDGNEGLNFAMEELYDAIILDVMVPQKNGWEILSAVRKNNISTPIIMLTARDQVNDRVKGLELGADDYLVKPFAFTELLARLRSIVRRGPNNTTSRELNVADLSIDLVQYRAHRNGLRLELTPKEFTLLSLLMRRTGAVLSRSIIAEQVWDMSFESGTNIVDVHVRRLRSKVDDPFEKKLIHTIRGIGYVLEDRS